MRRATECYYIVAAERTLVLRTPAFIPRTFCHVPAYGPLREALIRLLGIRKWGRELSGSQVRNILNCKLIRVLKDMGLWYLSEGIDIAFNGCFTH